MARRFIPLRDWSIAAKLRLLIMSACLVVIGLTCCAFVIAEYFAFRAGLQESLMVRARIAAMSAAAPLAFNSMQDAEATLESLRADPNTLVGVVYDAQGRVFAVFPDGALGAVPTVPVGGELIQGGTFSVRVPIELNSKQLGSLLIEQSLTRVYQRMGLYGAVALTFMLLASVVAYLLAGRFQRTLSTPILALVKSAHAVADRKDYTVRPVKVGEDEIGVLTDAFNSMLTRLQDNERLLEAKVKERTEELVAANNELESFSYSVSHDLRAPLRAVIGMTDIIVEDFDAVMPEEAKQHLGSIRRHAQRMNQLISDMLEFSRKSRQQPVVERVDSNAIVAAVLGDFREEIKKRAVVVEVEPLPPCQADPSLLQQVLLNLVSNAMKYSRGRSPARITIGTVPSAEPQRVTFYIKDNGVGFKMEYAHRLFEPFQRLHAADKFEGTGVGLALAYRVIRRHGGKMWVEARPEAGATFYFSLPAE